MKHILLTALLTFTTSFCLLAQDFPGFRAGNYTGVNGVFFNPASIADSRYRFDFNLVSASTFVGNDNASFKIKNLTNSFDSESLQNQVFGPNAGLSTGMVSVDIHGPSLMFNAGRKTAIALTTRARTMANIIDIDGKLANQILDEADGDQTFPYAITSNANMQVAVNAWTEIGLSYARVFRDEGAHFFKGGFTFKYLGGVTNNYVNIDQLKGTITEDAAGSTYLTNATGRVGVGIGGIDVSDMELTNFRKFESSGFGGDLGFVYEFRPNHEAYKSEGAGTWMQDRNKYKLKVGVALLDIGAINYDRDAARSGDYSIDITGNERLSLADLSDTEIGDYKSFFDARPQFFNASGANSGSTYKVSLPTTLQLDVDYHLHRGFYAQLATQLPLNSKTIFNSRYYSSVTLTPRYEGKAIGFYVPFNYNSLTKFNAGVSLRFGPLFIGSGSLLTAALGNSRQADVHVGLHLAGLQKNMQKKEDKKERRRLNRESRNDNQSGS